MQRRQITQFYIQTQANTHLPDGGRNNCDFRRSLLSHLALKRHPVVF